MQLASVSFATQALLLGSAALSAGIGDTPPVLWDRRLAGRPSFLKMGAQNVSTARQFIWGDVLKGIEEMSHNVTAALLTLELGNLSSQCPTDQLDVQVYRYSSRALWIPYGVSNPSLLSCYNLTFFPLCFLDGLGHCSNFTHYCRLDDDDKSNWAYEDVIFGYGYFSEAHKFSRTRKPFDYDSGTSGTEWYASVHTSVDRWYK